MDLLDHLMHRRSPPIVAMTGPEPTAEQIDTMLTIACRVPDHGPMTPWRFILYRGENRHVVGKALADLLEKREGPLEPGRRQKEEERFSRAPLVIGVVCCPKPNEKIPQWEMLLSAGAAAMNLVHAASAVGLSANWITNWYADDDEAKPLLGVKADERAVGFVHIGHFDRRFPDRERPDPHSLTTDYIGPLESGPQKG